MHPFASLALQDSKFFNGIRNGLLISLRSYLLGYFDSDSETSARDRAGFGCPHTRAKKLYKEWLLLHLEQLLLPWYSHRVLLYP